jgi:hypothetical protein
MTIDERYQNQNFLVKFWRRRFTALAVWKISTFVLQPGFWRIYRQDSEDVPRYGFWHAFFVYRAVTLGIAHYRMKWFFSAKEAVRLLEKGE